MELTPSQTHQKVGHAFRDMAAARTAKQKPRPFQFTRRKLLVAERRASLILHQQSKLELLQSFEDVVNAITEPTESEHATFCINDILLDDSAVAGILHAEMYEPIRMQEV